MSANTTLLAAHNGASSPQKICATALAFLPALAWAASASGQPVSAGADTLNDLVATQSLTAAYSLSAVAARSSALLAVAEDSVGAAPAPSPEPSAQARDPQPAGTAERTVSAPAANELTKEMNNPVTSLWLIQFESNNYKLANFRDSPVGGKWVNNLYLQPVLPVNLTEDLALITRPVITVYQSVPHPTPTGVKRTTQFGDTILAQVISPLHTDPWIVAAGPTWIFPTAGSDFTGQGKWQLGPAVGGGYISNRMMIAGLVQQWWSIAGDSDRKRTSQMNILPLVYAFFGDGWSVGYSGYITADWKAPHKDVWTVPVGLSVGKVVMFGKLPVQIRGAGQYIPIRPDGGTEWNLQLQLTPIIPKLIKKTIFQ